MRVFFAVDETSHIRRSTLRQMLELRASRRQYEVLSLADSHFSCLRTDLDALREYAALEGQRVLERYTDATLCLVLVRAEIPHPPPSKRTVPADYAVLVRPKSEVTYQLLNPTFEKQQQTHFRVSSPRLQPELVEAAIELAGLEPLR